MTSNPTILVVEDERPIRMLLEQMLSSRGFHVHSAGDGREGLRAVETAQPDCLLTDLTMPRMNGVELIEHLRGRDEYADLPIVILSGLDNEEAMLRGFEAGADDYITKPFQETELVAKLKVVLQKKPRPATESPEPEAEDAFLPWEGAEPFGPFHVLAPMAAWKNGSVDKAFDMKRQKEVVLKRLDSGADDRARQAFENEIRILQAVDSPHVVRLLDHGEENGERYYAMESLGGPSLHALLAEKRIFDEEEVWDKALALARALADLHRQGVVHGNLLPDNIYFDDQGRARLGGFRRCRTVDPSAPLSDPAFDVCSLGALLHRLALGVFPQGFPRRRSFPTGTERKAAARSLDSAEVSQPLAHLVLEMLSQDASFRSLEAETLVRKLEERVEGTDRSGTAARTPQAPSLTLEDYNVFRNLQTRRTERVRTRRLEAARSPRPASKGGNPLLIGRVLNGFRVEKLLSQGGMGDVYLARQVQLNRPVALKILRSTGAGPASTGLSRFLREARSAANLLHANVVQVFDAGEAEGYHYIAMEFVEGRDLEKVLLREGPLEEGRARSLLRQALQALVAARARSIVHRDLKPANLILTPSGGLKVADFGLAKELHLSGDITLADHVVGTPAYMSPEQCTGGDVDSRSDIYSLGVTFFELLSGRKAFRGRTPVAVIEAHLSGDHPSLASLRPDLSPGLAALVERMMAREPAERFQGPEELLQDLEALPAAGTDENRAGETDEEPEPADTPAAPLPAPAAPEPRVRPGLRFLVPAVAAAALLLVSALLAGLGWLGGRQALPRRSAFGALRTEIPRPEDPAPAPTPARAATAPPAAAAATDRAPAGPPPGPPPGPTAPKEAAQPAAALSEEPVAVEDVIESIRRLARKGRHRQARLLLESAGLDRVQDGPGSDLAGIVEGLPEGFCHLGANPQGCHEYRSHRDGMILVRVPGGSFAPGEAHPPEPGALCRVSPFLLAKYEVTRAQFAAFRTAARAEDRGRQALPGISFDPAAGAWTCEEDEKDLPVSGLSWAEARDYAIWAGGDLPSELQWEYGALSGDGRAYPWGGEAPSASLCALDSVLGRMSPVGTHPEGRSPFGAADMAGNAYEWCLDTFETPFPARGWQEPDWVCRQAGPLRAVRGSPLRFTATRMGRRHDSADARVGFRYVVALER